MADIWRRVAMACQEMTIRLFDFATAREIASLDGHEHDQQSRDPPHSPTVGWARTAVHGAADDTNTPIAFSVTFRR